MTELEELTLRSIDKAYEAQVSKLYAVLCSASEQDIVTGMAIERFANGLERALKLRNDAIKVAAE